LSAPRYLALVAVAGSLLHTACATTPRRHDSATDQRPSPTISQAVFVNGGDCSQAQGDELPSDAGCVTQVMAEDESLTVYAILGKDDRPRSWHVRLESSTDRIDQVLRAGNDFSYPRALGASDIDHDGDMEWWIKVADYTSHGAPWSGANLFFRDRNTLLAVSSEGQPLVINMGGIARMGEGAACRGGRLVVLRAEALNRANTRWRVSERTFVLDGHRARLVGRERDVLAITDYNDPALDPYYRIDCEAFVYPS